MNDAIVLLCHSRLTLVPRCTVPNAREGCVSAAKILRKTATDPRKAKFIAVFALGNACVFPARMAPWPPQNLTNPLCFNSQGPEIDCSPPTAIAFTTALYCALRGEPLTEIAAKFDVPPADLVKMNSWDGHSGLHNLTKRSNLIVGTELTIPKLDGTDGGGVSTRPKAAAQARFAASNPHSVLSLDDLGVKRPTSSCPRRSSSSRSSIVSSPRGLPIQSTTSHCFRTSSRAGGTATSTS